MARLERATSCPPGTRAANCATSRWSLAGGSNSAHQLGGLTHHHNACKAWCLPPEPTGDLTGFNRP